MAAQAEVKSMGAEACGIVVPLLASLLLTSTVKQIASVAYYVIVINVQYNSD